jgi:hypothetical protein
VFMMRTAVKLRCLPGVADHIEICRAVPMRTGSMPTWWQRGERRAHQGDRRSHFANDAMTHSGTIGRTTSLHGGPALRDDPRFAPVRCGPSPPTPIISFHGSALFYTVLWGAHAGERFHRHPL